MILPECRSIATNSHFEWSRTCERQYTYDKLIFILIIQEVSVILPQCDSFESKPSFQSKRPSWYDFIALPMRCVSLHEMCQFDIKCAINFVSPCVGGPKKLHAL